MPKPLNLNPQPALGLGALKDRDADGWPVTLAKSSVTSPRPDSARSAGSRGARRRTPRSGAGKGWGGYLRRDPHTCIHILDSPCKLDQNKTNSLEGLKSSTWKQ